MPRLARNYDDLLSTAEGRAWLAAHHEARTAHSLRLCIERLEQHLYDPKLTADERLIFDRRLTAALHILLGRVAPPQPIVPERLLVLHAVLEGYSAPAWRKTPLDTRAAIAHDVLRNHLGRPLAAAKMGELLRKAIEAWPQRGKAKWPAAHALAVAVGAVNRMTDEASFGQTMSRLKKVRPILFVAGPDAKLVKLATDS